MKRINTLSLWNGRRKMVVLLEVVRSYFMAVAMGLMHGLYLINYAISWMKPLINIWKTGKISPNR